MSRILFALSTAFVLGLVPSCSNGQDSAEAQEESSPAASEPAPAAGESMHAPAGAEPGSHEDWCGEHAVPESQCTRCNPELTAAFKATGDWCDEHGLPESQCLKCNPDLEIVRPPADVQEQ